MFLKELIVDGFKSYANRTVVAGWDAEFNAITGFNGTGKSNLLDAICFVLGISNLASVHTRTLGGAQVPCFRRSQPSLAVVSVCLSSQVRVHGLQELVYKQGQSRVTKASVTIVFDNRQTAKSPIGFESCAEITVTRQIVVGGRNKYLINGHTAQLARVQNLFHSVGLNVNNPHFLIMQGRITKVCNMKPLETLGMIEEAAGTRPVDHQHTNGCTLDTFSPCVASLCLLPSQDVRAEEEGRSEDDPEEAAEGGRDRAHHGRGDHSGAGSAALGEAELLQVQREQERDRGAPEDVRRAAVLE
jgi:hypothetical protein